MRIRTLLSVGAAILLAGSVALAQGRGHSGPPPSAGHGQAHGHSGTAPNGPKAGHGPQDAGTHQGKPPDHSPGGATVVEHLNAQPQLRERLVTLLPAGTNIDQAASGFASLGHFVAAVNVSHNLGIPFDALKSRVTGSSAVSLGDAIHQLRPDANAKAEAERAETEARKMTGETGHK
jgi:hypothetical protein